LLETLSHLRREYFNRLVRSPLEAVEIAARGLSPQSQENIMLQIYDLFGDISNTANSLVVRLSNITERNLDWKMMKYKPYHDFLQSVDSSGGAREIMNQYHSAQQRKIRATKKLGDLWQHYP
jgi:hypothetical protein